MKALKMLILPQGGQPTPRQLNGAMNWGKATISTARKNGLRVMEALAGAISGNAAFPIRTCADGVTRQQARPWHHLNSHLPCRRY